MSDTGGLIVYKINGWQITTSEIKGGARAPWIRPWRSKDAGLMLAQRLRRWTNINQTFVQNIPTAVSVARLVVIWCLIGYIWSRCTISGCRVIFTLMWEANFISLQAHYSALFSFWLISLPSCSEYVLWELPSSATTMPFGISSRTNNERLWKCTNEW